MATEDSQDESQLLIYPQPNSFTMLGVCGTAVKIIGGKDKAGSSSNAGPKPFVKAKVQKSPAASPAKQRSGSSTPSPPKSSPKKKIPSPTTTVIAVEKPPSVEELARLALDAPPKPESSGTCIIAFNHYRKEFPVHNGVLKWKDVDAEYSFGYVYKGQYIRNLLLVKEPNRLGKETRTVSSSESAASDSSASGGGGGNDLPPYVQKDEASELFIDVMVGKFYQAIIEEGEDGIGAGMRIRLCLA